MVSLDKMENHELEDADNLHSAIESKINASFIAFSKPVVIDDTEPKTNLVRNPRLLAPPPVW